MARRSSQSVDRGAGCRDCFLGKTKQKNQREENGQVNTCLTGADVSQKEIKIT